MAWFRGAVQGPLRPLDASPAVLTRRRLGRRCGLTLIELIVAFAILLILSTMALPLARVRVLREKERRLHDAVTEMRKAIDRYKDYADAGKLGQVDDKTYGYPESLEILVEGVTISNNSGPGAFGNMPGGAADQGGFGSRNSRSNRGGFGSSGGGFGSNRGGSGSGGSGFGSSRGGGFGSNRGSGLGSSRGGGFGSSSGGFGQSNRGASSSRGGSGSSRGAAGGASSFGDHGSAGSEDEEEKKIRFLRRIPVDPMTGTADWGMRSVTDSPDSMSWGGKNVFDVYSKSMDTALDGTHYSEW